MTAKTSGGESNTVQGGQASEQGGARQGGATPAPGGGTATGGRASAAGSTLFADEFNDGALSQQWVAINRHGDFSGPDLACLTPANVAVRDGNLVLTSLVQKQTCGDSTHAPVSADFTSAAIQWKSFNFTYGTLEARAKLPGGQGPWPAIWLLGKNCQASNIQGADTVMGCDWPNAGSDEIDFVEVLSNDHTHINQQIHSGSNNAGCSAQVSDASQNWHTYKMVWKKDSLVWYIDGVRTCEQTNRIPSTPMFVIINTAMTGTIDAKTMPQQMMVDYITLTQP